MMKVQPRLFISGKPLGPEADRSRIQFLRARRVCKPTSELRAPWEKKKENEEGQTLK